MNLGKVYLLPMLLHEDGWEALPTDTTKWIQQCDAFFVENEKTTRRYFKKLWKEMVIDDYIWHPIHKVEADQIQSFTKLLKEGKNIVVAAHGNSLRALIMYLENMTPQQILEFEIGTAIPRHYELDADLKVLKAENL